MIHKMRRGSGKVRAAEPGSAGWRGRGGLPEAAASERGRGKALQAEGRWGKVLRVVSRRHEGQ